MEQSCEKLIMWIIAEGLHECMLDPSGLVSSIAAILTVCSMDSDNQKVYVYSQLLLLLQ